MNKPSLQIFHHLLAMAPTLSIYESADFLLEVDTHAYGSKTIYVHGMPTTYGDLVEDWHRLNSSVAELPRLYFMCGPPGEEEYRWGTAAQFIADSAMVAIILGRELNVLAATHNLLTAGAP